MDLIEKTEHRAVKNTKTIYHQHFWPCRDSVKTSAKILVEFTEHRAVQKQTSIHHQQSEEGARPLEN